MKKKLLSILLLMSTTVTHAQIVSLDASFGNNGIVTTAINGNAASQFSALQSDGKIVSVGYNSDSNVSSNYTITVVRYNIDGTLDTSFDTDGIVDSQIGVSITSIAFGVIIQSDGKILVAGQAFNSSQGNVVLIRLNTDGSLDTSFDSDGIVEGQLGSRADKVIIDNNGKILVVGATLILGYNNISVARFNTDGSIDNTFDNDGIVTTTFQSGNAQGFNIKIQDDGKILVAGFISNGTFNDVALVRFNEDGSLDPTFHLDGIVITSMGTGSSSATSLEILSNGKILVGGYLRNGTFDEMMLLRYLSDGNLDTSFDNDGSVYYSIGDDNCYILDLLLQNDNKLLVTGYSQIGAQYVFTLVRFNEDGSLDNSFDNDGIVTTIHGTDNSFSTCVLLQSDNKIVVTGSSVENNQSVFTLTRYQIASTAEVNEFSKNNIQVFPNPAKEFIQLTGLEAGNELRIVALNGTVVSVTKSLSTEETISIAHLENGVYFLHVFDNENFVTTKKILVNK